MVRLFLVVAAVVPAMMAAVVAAPVWWGWGVAGVAGTAGVAWAIAATVQSMAAAESRYFFISKQGLGLKTSQTYFPNMMLP